MSNKSFGMFYEDKENFKDVRTFLSNIKNICSNNNELLEQLQSRTAEVTKLQQAVSDLQVIIVKGREEKLKISRKLDDKATKETRLNDIIDNLLDILGASRTDLPKLIANRMRMGIEIKKHKQNSCDPELHDIKSLTVENYALKKEIEKIQRNHEGEIEILLKDRELVAEERIIETSRLRKDFCQLKRKYVKVQQELFDVTEQLIICQEKLENIPDEPVTARSITSNRSQLKETQEQLAECSAMKLVYRELAEDLEKDLNYWREKAETTEKNFKSKTEKLSSEIKIMKNRYDDLNRRRQLEAAGFRQDVKLLRDKLKDIEKKLVKIKNDNKSTQSALTLEDDLRASTKLTLKRARMLEQELLNLKRKMTSIDF